MIKILKIGTNWVLLNYYVSDNFCKKMICNCKDVDQLKEDQILTENFMIVEKFYKNKYQFDLII